jgi:sigma-B regulation protein RsbU (phosphoserine phosphatase)
MENVAQDELLAQLAALQAENISLRQENEDLQEMLEAVTEHSDTVSADLRHQAAILAETYQRTQDELALARQIQYGLLSPSHPDWDKLEVICYTTPATQVGGDFYAYHAFNDNHLALAVGDVSGKGVSAALLMATCLSLFQTSLLYRLTPAERLIYLDKMLMPYSKFRNQNCAMSYIEVEIKSKEDEVRSMEYEVNNVNNANNVNDEPVLFPTPYSLLHVVNAGCIPPYIKRVNGEVEQPEMGGFALGQGLGAIAGYQQLTIELSPGDMIILTSDGVVEANNIDGDMLGFDRLMQIVRDAPSSSNQRQGSEAVLEHLKREVFTFIGSAEPHDDITMVVAQVRGER